MAASEVLFEGLVAWPRPRIAASIADLALVSRGPPAVTTVSSMNAPLAACGVISHLAASPKPGGWSGGTETHAAAAAVF